MAYCKFWHGHLSTALCRVPCCALCAKDAALLFEEGRPPIKKPVDKRVVHWAAFNLSLVIGAESVVGAHGSVPSCTLHISTTSLLPFQHGPVVWIEANMNRQSIPCPREIYNTRCNLLTQVVKSKTTSILVAPQAHGRNDFMLTERSLLLILSYAHLVVDRQLSEQTRSISGQLIYLHLVSCGFQGELISSLGHVDIMSANHDALFVESH
eukprot:360870-Chlamydomonas_euryale.AAC.21